MSDEYWVTIIKYKGKEKDYFLSVSEYNREVVLWEINENSLERKTLLASDNVSPQLLKLKTIDTLIQRYDPTVKREISIRAKDTDWPINGGKEIKEILNYHFEQTKPKRKKEYDKN